MQTQRPSPLRHGLLRSMDLRGIPALSLRHHGMHSAQQCKLRHLQATSAAVSSAELPPNLKKIVGAFQMVPDEMARYKQLLFLAAKLPPLPQQYRSPENLVQGCVSQVWVYGELDCGTLKWQADSDSQLTKGLAALLVQGLGGCSPEEVMQVNPANIIESLGLKQKLTPSRNNGFLNMFRLMQQKASQLNTAQGQAQPSLDAAAVSVPAQSSNLPQVSAPAGDQAAGAAPQAARSEAPAAALRDQSNGSGSSSATPMKDSMQRKIERTLQPTRLVIVDESSQHAGHVGSRMKPGYSGETHFNVTVVSPLFEGQNTVKRHRSVYGLLKEELADTVHALSLVTRTPTEDASTSS